MALTAKDIGLFIVAIFLPPLAVFLAKEGRIDKDFWINLLLTILGWIPGIIHAIYILLKY